MVRRIGWGVLVYIVLASECRRPSVMAKCVIYLLLYEI